jgi:conjugal transfer/entry exclusion protein
MEKKKNIHKMNNNRLMELLKKYLVPGVLGGISVDSYRRTIYSHKKEIENLKTNISDQLEAANNRADQAEAMIKNNEILASERFNHVEASLLRLEEKNNKIQYYDHKISEIDLKLKDPKYEASQDLNSLTNLKD